MKRVPLPHGYELRVVRRRGSGVRGPVAVVLSLHRMNDLVGVIAVPTAIFGDLQRVVAGLSLVDIAPPAPSTPSDGEGAGVPELAASGLVAHTAGAVGGQP